MIFHDEYDCQNNSKHINECQKNSQLSTGLIVLGAFIEQMLIHFHEQLQRVVYVSVNCSAVKTNGNMQYKLRQNFDKTQFQHTENSHKNHVRRE